MNKAIQNINNLTLIQVVKIWESLLEHGTICSPPYQPLRASLVTAGKESACKEGDPVLISGSGRSPGEGIGYRLEYSFPWWLSW